MKRLISGLFAAAAIAGAAGCTENAYDRGYGGGMYVSGGDYYDGYYDDFYGPIYDGYWVGNDFYFRDADGHPYQRDDNHHFRREVAPGFHAVHGQMHGPVPHGRP